MKSQDPENQVIQERFKVALEKKRSWVGSNNANVRTNIVINKKENLVAQKRRFKRKSGSA